MFFGAACLMAVILGGLGYAFFEHRKAGQKVEASGYTEDSDIHAPRFA